MSLNELAARLGIKEYPDALTENYYKLDLTSSALVDSDILPLYILPKELPHGIKIFTKKKRLTKH